MSYLDTINNNAWNAVEAKIFTANENDVIRAISASKNNVSLDIDNMMALLSPVASAHLEEFATLSRHKTQSRFGKTIQLYIPLYLSNYCANHCVYCGFSSKNNIKRIALNDDEILKEVAVIKKMGYEHILLVTGESPHKVDVHYLLHCIEIIKPYFSSIAAEIQPLDTSDYKKLIDAGLNTVYVYQETYNQTKYRDYHPVGQKSDYGYRLLTPERLGEAGIYRIGLGALLGLENWRVEAYFIALHLRYLQKHYWRTKFSIAFPRIRPHSGSFQPSHPVSDKELAQLIFAFRLFDSDVEMALTTRESVSFRNNMLTLGITSISAGSKTEPGGYCTHINELEQFAVNDNRSADEIVREINQQGYFAIWKDWNTFR